MIIILIWAKSRAPIRPAQSPVNLARLGWSAERLHCLRSAIENRGFRSTGVAHPYSCRAVSTPVRRCRPCSRFVKICCRPQAGFHIFGQPMSNQAVAQKSRLCLTIARQALSFTLIILETHQFGHGSSSTVNRLGQGALGKNHKVRGTGLWKKIPAAVLHCKKPLS